MKRCKIYKIDGVRCFYEDDTNVDRQAVYEALKSGASIATDCSGNTLTSEEAAKEWLMLGDQLLSGLEEPFVTKDGSGVVTSYGTSEVILDGTDWGRSLTYKIRKEDDTGYTDALEIRRDRIKTKMIEAKDEVSGREIHVIPSNGEIRSIGTHLHLNKETNLPVKVGENSSAEFISFNTITCHKGLDVADNSEIAGWRLTDSSSGYSKLSRTNLSTGLYSLDSDEIILRSEGSSAVLEGFNDGTAYLKAYNSDNSENTSLRLDHSSEDQVLVRGKTKITEKTTITDDLYVEGNIFATGSSTKIHTEDITVADNSITLREGATVPIAAGQTSGFTIEKYDGVNDLNLGTDNSGWLRIGDVGNEQIIATREDSITDGNLVKFNASTNQFEGTGKEVDDFASSSINLQKITDNGATTNNDITIGGNLEVRDLTIDSSFTLSRKDNAGNPINALATNGDDYLKLYESGRFDLSSFSNGELVLVAKDATNTDTNTRVLLRESERAFRPYVDGYTDLGSNSKRFKDGFFGGNLEVTGDVYTPKVEANGTSMNLASNGAWFTGPVLAPAVYSAPAMSYNIGSGAYGVSTLISSEVSRYIFTASAEEDTGGEFTGIWMVFNGPNNSVPVIKPLVTEGNLHLSTDGKNSVKLFNGSLQSLRVNANYTKVN